MAMNESSNEIAGSGNEKQFLTFVLNQQDYGIDILRVQEIKGWSQVTPLPNSPAFIRGVLNLRGTIVPVIDLRLRFGIPEKEYDSFTVIMVVSVDARLAGLVVDSVSDVIDLGEDQLRVTPEFDGEINRKFIAGLGQIGERLFILLEAGKLVDDELLNAGTEEPVTEALSE